MSRSFLNHTPPARSSTFLFAALAAGLLLTAPARAQCNREAKLTTSDPNDKFGVSVSIGRFIVAVGASNDSSVQTYGGAVFVYSEVAGTWTLEQTLQPAGLGNTDIFGYSVAAGSGIVAASALFDDDAGTDAGAVYVFRKDPGGWVEEQKLTPPVPGNQLNFGRAIAMDGNVLAVSEWPTAVHVYRRSGTTWTREASLTPSFSSQRFGTDVAVYGDRIVVGDPEYGFAEGAVEVYRYTSGTGWASEHTEFGAANGALFGSSVDVYGSRFIAGAWGEANTGLAHVFAFDAGTSTWSAEQTLVGSDSQSGDGFGYTVSMSSVGVYAGAPAHDAIASNAGAVYAFTFNGTVWSQANKMAPTVLAASDNFGTTLDATSDLLAVGNRFQATPDARAVYVFDDCP